MVAFANAQKKNGRDARAIKPRYAAACEPGLALTETTRAAQRANHRMRQVFRLAWVQSEYPSPPFPDISSGLWGTPGIAAGGFTAAGPLLIYTGFPIILKLYAQPAKIQVDA